MLPEFVSMSRLTFLRLETLPTLRSLLLFVLTLFHLSPSPEALGIVEFANSSIISFNTFDKSSFTFAV